MRRSSGVVRRCCLALLPVSSALSVAFSVSFEVADPAHCTCFVYPYGPRNVWHIVKLRLPLSRDEHLRARFVNVISDGDGGQQVGCWVIIHR